MRKSKLFRKYGSTYRPWRFLWPAVSKMAFAPRPVLPASCSYKVVHASERQETGKNRGVFNGKSRCCRERNSNYSFSIKGRYFSGKIPTFMWQESHKSCHLFTLVEVQWCGLNFGVWREKSAFILWHDAPAFVMKKIKKWNDSEPKLVNTCIFDMIGGDIPPMKKKSTQYTREWRKNVKEKKPRWELSE